MVNNNNIVVGMISRWFLFVILKYRYFETLKQKMKPKEDEEPKTKINSESLAQDLIEDDERERLGS